MTNGGCMNEQTITIASKLYEARRTLRRLQGDCYAARILPWMKRLQPYGDNILPSVLKAATKMAGDGEDIAILWTLAAAVELIEPDAETPKL